MSFASAAHAVRTLIIQPLRAARRAISKQLTLVLPTGRGELEYQVHLANAPRAAAPTEPEQAEGTGSSL